MSWLDERVELRAILLGLSVDWFGTSLFVALLAMVLGGTGIVAEEQMEAFFSSPGFLLFGGLVGLAFTGLGGFVAARVAGAGEIKHAAITGVLSLVLGALMMMTSQAPEGQGAPWWYMVSAYLLPVPAALLGGWVAERLKGPVEPAGPESPSSSFDPK